MAAAVPVVVVQNEPKDARKDALRDVQTVAPSAVKAAVNAAAKAAQSAHQPMSARKVVAKPAQSARPKASRVVKVVVTATAKTVQALVPSAASAQTVRPATWLRKNWL